MIAHGSSSTVGVTAVSSGEVTGVEARLSVHLRATLTTRDATG